MRRSICYSEPMQAKAGEVSTWRFIYKPSSDLPKGSMLKFDLETEGRPILPTSRIADWEVPSTNIKSKNLILAKLPNGKIIKAKKVEKQISQFEFLLPSKVASGNPITIVIGNLNGKSGGNRAQTFSQRKRKFTLYIDKEGKGNYREKEMFHIDVKGNILKNLRIMVPSFISRNKRFDVIVRFEDEFGNLTGFAEENTLIDLSYQNLRENLNWKLFVPETGFITLPNLYFNEPGIYRIQLKNERTKDIFLSSPIKCFADSDLSLYWGTFHGESERFDATREIESCLRVFRDEKAYQFYATSPFDDQEEISNETWKYLSPFVSEFNEDFRFTSFLGFQWVGIEKEEGVRQFIYLKDNKPILRKKDLKTNSLKKIYKICNPKDIISIPTFTMGRSSPFDFQHYNEEFERVVEIYNAWGSSECSKKEGNPKPIQGKCSEFLEGSIQKALMKNRRFGFVAGGFDDRGIYSRFYDSDQKQYTPGLTAIIAESQTKEHLFNAIRKRACYATTGARILLEFYIANNQMGSEMNTANRPGLMFNRFITASIVGTTGIKKVDLIRNGKIFKSFTPKEDRFDFEIDDSENLFKISLKDGNSLFSYYYLRIQQTDGNIAWSSPIWIDISEIKKTSKT